MSAIGPDNARKHVERGSFTCTVRPEQSYYFSLFYVDGNFIHNHTAAIAFYKFITVKFEHSMED